MFDHFIEQLARSSMDDDNDYKVYRYAFNRLKTILVWCVLLFIVGIVSGSIKTTLMILLAIMPIRKFGGGYHLKSEIGCFVISSMMLYAATRIAMSEHVPLLVIFFISSIAGFFILITGTIESENNPLSQFEIKVFGMITRFFLGLDFIITIISYFFGFIIFVRSILLAIIICAVLQMIGAISRRNENKK